MSSSESHPRADKRIGPGKLILVVGPSGAGKDSLIGHARLILAHDDRVVFPRRAITRQADATEDSLEVKAECFQQAALRGDYVLHWSAHGHRYGLPASMARDVGEGRIAIANVSRRIIDVARSRFADVRVVMVTASAEILAKRLVARGRDLDIASRLQRASDGDAAVADFTIHNNATLEAAATQLVDFLRACMPGAEGRT